MRGFFVMRIDLFAVRMSHSVRHVLVTKPTSELFTCGHSTRPFDELVHLLRTNGITLLVDVRTVPKSRYHPWFNRTHMEKQLPMKYLWRGDVLGGKNAHLVPPEVFQAGIDELAVLSGAERICIMCSERDPGPSRWSRKGCHRWYAIAPALQAKGMEVIHL